MGKVEDEDSRASFSTTMGCQSPQTRRPVAGRVLCRPILSTAGWLRWGVASPIDRRRSADTRGRAKGVMFKVVVMVVKVGEGEGEEEEVDGVLMSMLVSDGPLVTSME
jgi:hypothetical protein